MLTKHRDENDTKEYSCGGVTNSNSDTIYSLFEYGTYWSWRGSRQRLVITEDGYIVLIHSEKAQEIGGINLSEVYPDGNLDEYIKLHPEDVIYSPDAIDNIIKYALNNTETDYSKKGYVINPSLYLIPQSYGTNNGSDGSSQSLSVYGNEVRTYGHFLSSQIHSVFNSGRFYKAIRDKDMSSLTSKLQVQGMCLLSLMVLNICKGIYHTVFDPTSDEADLLVKERIFELLLGQAYTDVKDEINTGNCLNQHNFDRDGYIDIISYMKNPEVNLNQFDFYVAPNKGSTEK